VSGEPVIMALWPTMSEARWGWTLVLIIFSGICRTISDVSTAWGSGWPRIDMICCNAPVGSCDEASGRMAMMTPEETGGVESCGGAEASRGSDGVQPMAVSRRQNPSIRLVWRLAIPWSGVILRMRNATMPSRKGKCCGRQVLLAEPYRYSLVGYIALFKPSFSLLL